MAKYKGKKQMGWKYLAYAGVAVVIILALLWPKTAFKWDDETTVANGEFIKNMNCKCMGLVVPQDNCRSCTQYADCYGIPTDCQYSCKRLVGDTWVDEPCGLGASIGPISSSPENSLTAGDNHFCELQPDRTVRCWGQNR